MTGQQNPFVIVKFNIIIEWIIIVSQHNSKVMTTGWLNLDRSFSVSYPSSNTVLKAHYFPTVAFEIFCSYAVCKVYLLYRLISLVVSKKLQAIMSVLPFMHNASARLCNNLTNHQFGLFKFQLLQRLWISMPAPLSIWYSWLLTEKWMWW